MFSPEPARSDGWMTMPAVLADGSKADLLWGDPVREGSERYSDPLYTRWTKVQERMANGLQKGSLKLALDESLAYVQAQPWFVTSVDGVTQETIRNRSWSDYSWILLLFLGLFALEGLLASLFSHHLRQGEALAPPAARVGRPAA